jgi:hypothetical protein
MNMRPTRREKDKEHRETRHNHPHHLAHHRAIAAGQRNYYNHMPSCGGTGTTIVTILAGPLNYVGVNPKLSCH